MMSGLCAQAESVKPLSGFKDTIIARAEEAWESDNGEVMFIRGDLQLRGSHWRIHADTARVEGKSFSSKHLWENSKSQHTKLCEQD